MAHKIISVEPDSPAARAGIKAGDELLKINNRIVRDRFDLEYYGSAHDLTLQFKDPVSGTYSISLRRNRKEDLGIEIAPYTPRVCHNNCIFCFIDQMPIGMRESLYLKDDDYIYSLLMGNYITLTNLSNQDFRRIYEQNISPLYISLHSTDKDMRQKLMRYQESLDPLKVLKRMASSGIEFHIQIVSVPDYNDKEDLRKTLVELIQNDLPCLSIGIVPVGLTKFREYLSPLKPFDKEGAKELLGIVADVRKRYKTDIIYPADEFFLLAGEEIPDDEYYQDYPQLENGIGMLRLGWENYLANSTKLLKAMKQKKQHNYRFFSSIAAQEHIQKIATHLNSSLKDARVEVQAIRNDFFGGYINVAGLLTYQDIAMQAQIAEDEIAVLPASILNKDNLSLDGQSLDELKKLFNNKLLIIDPLFEDWDWA